MPRPCGPAALTSVWAFSVLGHHCQSAKVAPSGRLFCSLGATCSARGWLSFVWGSDHSEAGQHVATSIAACVRLPRGFCVHALCTGLMPVCEEGCGARQRVVCGLHRNISRAYPAGRTLAPADESSNYLSPICACCMPCSPRLQVTMKDQLLAAASLSRAPVPPSGLVAVSPMPAAPQHSACISKALVRRTSKTCGQTRILGSVPCFRNWQWPSPSVGGQYGT